MKKLYDSRCGDVTGSLYRESLGYTWKIRRKNWCGGSDIIARSCVYFNNESQAIEQLHREMDIITNQLKLF
jgi:hypothetical protein